MSTETEVPSQLSVILATMQEAWELSVRNADVSDRPSGYDFLLGQARMVYTLHRSGCMTDDEFASVRAWLEGVVIDEHAPTRLTLVSLRCDIEAVLIGRELRYVAAWSA